jgi:hypothetical protein
MCDSEHNIRHKPRIDDFILCVAVAAAAVLVVVVDVFDGV